jgi:membrane associated rhomboid family serine protease
MVQAPVGFHCPECARGGRQRVYTSRTLRRVNAPIVTQVLVGVNVAVFLLGLSQSHSDLLAGNTSSFIQDYGLVGSLVTRFGAIVPGVGVAEGEWWRLVTGGFLHAGLLHLGLNMLALWILGSQLEPAIGRTRFALVYGASLLAASLGVMILSPHDVTVGASGAIFGLFGLALAAQLSQGINVWASGLGGILLINLLFTFGVPGISIGGHLGGLAGGFLCGEILYGLTPRMSNKAVPALLCAALGVICAVSAMVVAGASA